MRVSVEEQSSVEKKLDVFIPAEEVKEKFQKVFKEFQQSARIRGFRQGKVPGNVILSIFGEDILKEVASQLISESFEGALKESSFTPVSKPDITPDKVDKEKEFHYTATFEIVPDFELPEYTGIPVKKEKYEVKDDSIDHTLGHLRERAAESRPLEEEREARKGDYVIVDYEGTLNGKSVKDLKKSDVQFLVGEGKLIPEFEENILGMKKGEEKGFQVSYPEGFQIPEVAGKTVDFKLTVKDVRERYLPELDDEFAKVLGEESLESLKKKIREDYEKRFEEESQMRVRGEIMKTLIEKTALEVPPVLIADETKRLIHDFQHNLERQGASLSQVTEEMQKKFAERAVRNVKASLVIGAIAKKEGIEVERKELDSKLGEIANSYQVPLDTVKKVYETNNMMPTLEAGMTEDKVFKFLLEKAVIEEVAAGSNQIDNAG